TPSCSPTPSRLKDRRRDRSLFQERFHRILCEELKDVRQWETVLLSKRNVDAVVCRGSLQFEIESAAKPLAKCKSPCFVDASAKRRMQNELHAATCVKESLGNNSCLRWNSPKHCTARHDIRDQLLRTVGAYSALLHQPRCGRDYLWLQRRDVHRGDGPRKIRDFFAKFANT